MAQKQIMVVGSGRLANRLIKFLKDENAEVVEIASKEFREKEETFVEESSMEYARQLLIKKGIANTFAVCVVDSEDAVNIYLLLAILAVKENVPIYASFFNASLVSNLRLEYPNVRIFDPAGIVSKSFLKFIPTPSETIDEWPDYNQDNNDSKDELVTRLVLGFVGLISFGALFFWITEPIDWQKSFYLIITVITSVNFSDAELTNYDPLAQNLRMVLMLATYAYVILALAFIVDHIVKRRTDVLTLGRKKYQNRGHVIVCGLGRVGYAITKELFAAEEDVVVIESDPENKYLSEIRSYKIPVLIGDATLRHYLADAGVTRAKALVCAIDSDLTNLEIGLNARSENQNIRLLLRIFDQSTAEEMKKRLGIHHVFSKSYTTAKVILEEVLAS